MERALLRKIKIYIEVSLPWYISIPVILFSILFPILFGCDTYESVGAILDGCFSFLAVLTFSNAYYIELQQNTAEIYNLLPIRRKTADILKRLLVRFLFLTCMTGVCFAGYTIKGLHVYVGQEAGTMFIQAFFSVVAVMFLFGSIGFLFVNLSGNMGVGIGTGIVVWMILTSISIVTEESGEEYAEEEAEEEKKEKIVYYVTDEQQQSQYINMFKAAGMDAVILTHNIDQPFISQLESKNEGVKFLRIDADLTDTLKDRTSKEAEKEMEEQTQAIAAIMKKALKNDKITVKVEKLKNKKVSSVITLSEESRRMQDMMKMYSMNGMDMGGFGAEGETLVLNASHPLVQYVVDHQDGENVEMICEQLYDLARIQHAPLAPEAMTAFIARSNDIMMILAK